MRSGDAYVASLRDGGRVLERLRVDDVTSPAFVPTHPRIAEPTLARRPPRNDPPSRSLDATTGARHSNMLLVPRWPRSSRAPAPPICSGPALVRLMGVRDPRGVRDHAFSAWGATLFDGGGARFGDHVERFYAQRSRRRSLRDLLRSCRVPGLNRSRPRSSPPGPFLHPGVVRETSAVIVVSRAHAIAPRRRWPRLFVS